MQRHLLLFILLLLPRMAGAAGLPTFDAGLNALGVQQQWLQLQEFYESAQQTANQVKQLENQVRQITGIYTQVDHGIRNLARLDVNNLTDLYGMMHQLQSKLSQAEYIGYAVQRTWGQAQALYPKVYTIMPPDQRRQLNLQWAAMRRNSAHVAIQTQAIRDAQARYQQQWADLIAQTERITGNVQGQQVQIQAQALVGNQLLALEQQLATQARQQSEQALEQATRTEIEQYLADKALAPLEGTYSPHGQLHALPSMTGRH